MPINYVKSYHAWHDHNVRRGPLAAIALVAGCFEPASHQCAGGWVCPEKLACATAPSYCGVPEQVAKCQGRPDWTTCAAGEVLAGTCRGSVCEMCTTDREGCSTGGWVSMMAGGSVTALWTAIGQGIAVGPPNRVVEYNGIGWGEPVAFPPVNGALKGVWGTGDGRAFAVASSGDIFARDTTGAWTHAFTAPAGLNAIWGSDASHVVAVGDSGTVARYDGTTWTTEAVSPAAPLFAVWGTSDGADVFAVGKCGAVFRRQGSTWAVSRTPSCGTLPDLAGVWGSDASHVYAVGGTTTADVEYFDGTWTTETVPSSLGLTNLSGVWGRSATDVVAIDHTGDLLALQSPDPATWSAMKIEAGVDFQAITGTPAVTGQFIGDTFIGAANGTIYRYAP